MAERNMLFDIEAVKEAIESHHSPRGISVDLVDGTTCLFRIRRSEENVYYGLTDDGRGVTMNIVTGQFDIGD